MKPADLDVALPPASARRLPSPPGTRMTTPSSSSRPAELKRRQGGRRHAADVQHITSTTPTSTQPRRVSHQPPHTPLTALNERTTSPVMLAAQDVVSMIGPSHASVLPREPIKPRPPSSSKPHHRFPLPPLILPVAPLCPIRAAPPQFGHRSPAGEVPTSTSTQTTSRRARTSPRLPFAF